jgi:hypothetical protein
MEAERGSPIVHERQANDVPEYLTGNASRPEIADCDPLGDDVGEDDRYDDWSENACPSTPPPEVRAFHLPHAACT